MWQEKTIKRLGSDFDKAGKRKERERAAFDAELAAQVQRAATRLTRDNDFVYYKRVPPAMPQDVLTQGEKFDKAHDYRETMTLCPTSACLQRCLKKC